MQKFKISKHNLLFLISVLAVAAIMVASLLYTLKTTTVVLDEVTRSSLENITYEKKVQINNLLEDIQTLNANVLHLTSAEALAKSFVNEGKIDTGLRDDVRKDLKNVYKNVDGLFENFFVASKKTIIADSIDGASESYVFTDDAPVTSYLDSTKPHKGFTVVSPISGRPISFVMNPILDSKTNAVYGQLMIPVDLITMVSHVMKLDNAKAQAFLISKEGLVYAASNQKYILKLNFAKKQALKNFFKTIKSKSTGTGTFTLNGTEYIASFTKLGFDDLTILTALPINTYMLKIDSMRNNLIMISVAGILLMTLILFLFIYLSTKPLLGRLTQAMVTSEAIAQGNLTNTITLSGEDEGTRLLQALTTMQESLYNTVGNIISTSHNLSDNSNQLNDVAKHMDEGLRNQGNAIEHVSGISSGIRKTFESMNQLANDATKASEEGNEEAQRGKVNVEKSLVSMEELSVGLNDSSNKISTLAEQIVSVSTVLEVIGDIADQTNLLSLNAAIEAARAGEHGRGFAVVADEVRKLAERTQKSLGEINIIIKGIQDGTRDAVDAMNNSNNMALETLQIARESGEVLDLITQLMEDINTSNQKVSQVSKEQTKAVQEIDQSLHHIRTVAEQGIEGSNLNKKIGLELSQLAKELGLIVNAFKV
ncbi:MAG: methyl-accepting chemotaxis protein [Sulfurospirillaceae bacterium]|nr:methyl-accepting chemotaxis protein [Sulfurospirillaceae bacterium]